MKYIYSFTNLQNNKKYIGSTMVEPKIRYNQHLYNSRHENTHQYNYPLYQAFRKYGIENFQFDILESIECNEETLRVLERDYILKYNTLSPNGYNQTLNTEHPLQDSNSYQKMSLTKREQAKEVAEIDKNYNVLCTWRSIIDCAEQTGLDEKKIAAVCRGERKTTEERIFCWISNGELVLSEYKRDPYKGAIGTTQIQSSSRKVAKINLQSNQIIATYDTIALAARENQIDASGISKVCRGLRKQTGGFGWKYIDI